MDDNINSSEPKGKEPEASASEVSPEILSWKDKARRPSEAGRRILFAPDTRERLRRETTTLTLSRTFSRQSRFSSYSAADDEEIAKVKRLTTQRTIEPQTRLPTGKFAIARILIVLAYRTLSIQVTDTVSHGV